ncbi:hypothetical protein [Marinobacter zhanjiangensis]|uniref:hypothetical protein n=1 Tax=Marinobacter zhanjiangensis TaxID=578215 RepID=UPI0016771E14|nr:hypothetical protein [Marinobacter zhanjiangensis]
MFITTSIHEAGTKSRSRQCSIEMRPPIHTLILFNIALGTRLRYLAWSLQTTGEGRVLFPKKGEVLAAITGPAERTANSRRKTQPKSR